MHGDIRDQPLVEALLRTHHVDIVVNFAAESHNSMAILRPGEFSTNIIGWYREHPEWWQPLLGRSPGQESAWPQSGGPK